MSSKRSAGPKLNIQEEVTRLRALAHDLSNALEAILQASYLLSHGKNEADNKKWARLIETSSEQAARINREMRKLLRALSDEAERHS
jgi:K+-sensing histidine kinase KdpD